MINKTSRYKKALIRATQLVPDPITVRADGTIVLGNMKTWLIFTAENSDLIDLMISEVPELNAYKPQCVIYADGIDWPLYYPRGADVQEEVDDWIDWMKGGGDSVGTWNLAGWGIVPGNNDGAGDVKVAQIWDPRDPDAWCDDEDYTDCDEDE